MCRIKLDLMCRPECCVPVTMLLPCWYARDMPRLDPLRAVCVLQYVAACYSVLQRVAACRSMLQRVAACRSVFQRIERAGSDPLCTTRSLGGSAPRLFVRVPVLYAATPSVLSYILALSHYLKH